MMIPRPPSTEEFSRKPVSASPPNALSNVLQRISHEPRASEAVPEAPAIANGLKMYGFDEPVASARGTSPEPAPEEIVALLAEQPEVAWLADTELSAVEELVALAAEPTPQPMAEPPPQPEEGRVPKPARFASPPPEPPLDRSDVLIARLSNRLGPVPPRPALREAPEEPVQAAATSAEALPPDRPIEPPREAAPASFPAPEMDHAGRQSLSRNRRLHRRVRLGAEIEIDGVPCTLIDVSIGGFAVTGIVNLIANKIVPVTLRLTIDGIEVGTRVNARIIYAHRERSSGRFIDLTPSQTAFLRYIVTWRGESVGMVGTTTLLDAITGGPEHGFSAKASNGSKERWWAGLIGWKANPPR